MTLCHPACLRCGVRVRFYVQGRESAGHFLLSEMWLWTHHSIKDKGMMGGREGGREAGDMGEGRAP